MSSGNKREVANNSRTIHRSGACRWARKALSVVLAPALCVTMCPISAYADDQAESAVPEQEVITPSLDEATSGTPALDELVTSMPQASPREVVQFANEWLATHVVFDPEAESTLAATDRLAVVEQLLITGAGDAAAFAFAFQALMDQADIPSICVQNEAGMQVWNMVELDGEWLHVDAAKNAQAFDVCEEADVETHTCFTAYLLVNDEVLATETEDAAAFVYHAVEGFELPEAASSDGEEQGEEVETPAVKDDVSTEEPSVPETSVPDEEVPEIVTPEKEQPADEPVVVEPIISEPADESADEPVGESASDPETPSIKILPGDLGIDVQPFANTVTPRAASRILPYNASHIAQVGKQQGAGSAHQYCCAKYACAYGDTMLLGSAQAHHNTYAYGSPDSGMCSWKYWTRKSTGSLKVIYDEINAGRPAILHVKGNSSTTHYLLVIGYTNVSNANNITLSNLIALDPYDGKQIVVSSKYSRNSTNQIQMSTRGLSVGTHTHNFPVASYTYYHSSTHRVTYKNCTICNTSKADTFANHDFQWCGLTNKCTLCGAVYDKDTYMMEYFTNQQTTLYEKAGYNQKALLTIPKGVVVKPLEKPRDYAAGRFQLYIEYKGKRGYVWASDVTLNNNGGVHTWKNGKCTTCGIAQAPSQPGTYKITADKIIYKDNALRGAQKKLKAGDTIVVTKVETTTSGWLWGRTADGYTLEMTYANMKYVSSAARNGTVTTIPEGIYVIRSAANRYYGLDINGASTANGANLQLWQDKSSSLRRILMAPTSSPTFIQVKRWMCRIGELRVALTSVSGI